MVIARAHTLRRSGAAFTLANVIARASVVITVPFVLALYRGPKETGREYALGASHSSRHRVGCLALDGASVGVGLRADLYDASPADERSAVVLSKYAHSWNFAILQVASLFVVFHGALFLKATMYRNGDYGTTFGRLTVLSDLLGIVPVAVSLGGTSPIFIGVDSRAC